MIDWEVVEIPYDPRREIAYLRLPDAPASVLHQTGRWVEHDPRHPRCYWCGKFVPCRTPDGWTGPCRDCDEPTGWWL